MKVGDKVVCVAGYSPSSSYQTFPTLVEGQMYLVSDITPSGTICLEGHTYLDGSPTYWGPDRFRVMEKDALADFKEALDNLRAEGYTVEVKLTKTIVEEL